MGVIGLREILAMCGIIFLNVGLIAVDWRIASVITGGLLLMLAVAPLAMRK